MSHLHLGFLVSGQGTLFETIARKCLTGELDATPAILISSNPDAPALMRASRLGVSCTVLQRTEFESGARFADALVKIFSNYGVDFVCLAGYLKLVPSEVVKAFRGRMLNIHPALLPAFGGRGMYGRKVHEAVLESGVRITGATVHLVDEEYDHGPIVLQRPVFVKQDDSAESLESRVHAVEHDLYVSALRLFIQNRIRVEGRRVHILPANQA